VVEEACGDGRDFALLRHDYDEGEVEATGDGGAERFAVLHVLDGIPAWNRRGADTKGLLYLNAFAAEAIRQLLPRH
jgi:hypothetical protein